jgi:hypothetical protein
MLLWATRGYARDGAKEKKSCFSLNYVQAEREKNLQLNLI